MLDSLKEIGINVELIMRFPVFWTSGIMILLILVGGVASNDWIEFLRYLSIMFAWMLGVFFGFKVLLLRIAKVEKEKEKDE